MQKVESINEFIKSSKPKKRLKSFSVGAGRGAPELGIEAQAVDIFRTNV